MPHVGIAGAGIGGLTAAIALAAKGARVSVFERAPVLAEVGAGLQLSPNACRLLHRLGLLDALARDAVAPEALMMRRGKDANLLARLPFGAVAHARFGAPFLVTHRADLQRVLLSRAREFSDVSINLGMPLSGWRSAAEGIELAFADSAARHKVDALVGADGIGSMVRQSLGKAAAAFSGRSAWRTMIDAEAVPAFARARETNLWLGPQAHLVHYPVRGGTLVNVVAIIVERRDRSAATREDFWSARGDPAYLEQKFRAWAEPVRRLLATAPNWQVWPLLDAPAETRWSAGAVTLLGDAAHPMLPFLAQGSAQAIEDAAALAEAVARTPERMNAAFGVYEALRQPRATRVQAESRRQAKIYHLPPPASTVRDLALRGLGPNLLLARYDWLYAGSA